MRLTLHIGRPKTASSSIQKWLALSSKDLESRGVYLPSFLGKENHRLIYTIVKDAFGREDVGFLRRGIREQKERKRFSVKVKQKFHGWMKNLPENSHVIISCEQLSSLDEEEIGWLKKYLNRYFKIIDVVVYLRRQDLSYVSLYNTKILSGSTHLYSEKFSFSESAPKNYYYDKFLGLWASLYGKKKILVRCLDKKFLWEGSVVADLTYCLGLERVNDLTDYDVSNNQSVSAEMLEFVRLLNKDIKESQKIDKYKAAQLGALIQTRAKMSDDNGVSFKPGRGSAEEFYRKFIESNREVAKDYLGRDELFSEDFSMYPEVPAAISYEAMLKSSIKFCSALLSVK